MNMLRKKTDHELIQDFQDWYNQLEKEGVKRYKLECLFLKIKTQI